MRPGVSSAAREVSGLGKRLRSSSVNQYSIGNSGGPDDWSAFSHQSCQKKKEKEIATDKETLVIIARQTV